MASSYTTEIEALNALCDKIDALATEIASLGEAQQSILTAIGTVNTSVGTVNTSVNTVNTSVNTVNTTLGSTNVKLDSANELLTGLRGAVVDVKNIPEDVRIARVYVGDVSDKREASETAVNDLLAEGYRFYQSFGVSEDLARVLLAKYPDPNTPAA